MKKTSSCITFNTALRPSRSAAILSAFILSGAIAQQAFAANRTWSGSTGNLWSAGGAGGNWTELSAPVANDSLIFRGSTNTSTINDLAADTVIAGTTAITFDNTVTSSAFTLSGNRITLGSSITTTGSLASPITHTIGMDMVLNGSRFITTAANNNINITGVISQIDATGRSITKQGEGILTLSAVNTQTGATTINNGTLRFGVDSALSTSVNVTSNGAGRIAILDLNGFNATIGSLNLGGAGGTATSSNQVLTGSGTLTLGNNVAVSASGNPTAASLIAGNVDLGANSRNFTVSDSTGTDVDLLVTAKISSVGGVRAVISNGAGTMKLENVANTYTGRTEIIGGGVVIATKLANGGIASSIGASGTSAGNLILSNGTLRYEGAGDSTDRAFSYGTGGATFDASGSGAVVFTNTNAPTNSGSNNIGRSITLTGTNTGNNTFSASVADIGTGVVTLVKEGTGKWVLAGVSTYTGTTNINAGTLVLASTSSINNSDAVAIDSDATFDTTAKSFVMLSNQEFNFTLDAAGAGSAGRLVAGALNIGTGVVNLNVIGSLDDSVYILADYTSLTGTQFQSVTTVAGYTVDYAYNGGTQIALVAVPEPAAAALLTGGLCAVLFFRRNRRKLS